MSCRVEIVRAPNGEESLLYKTLEGSLGASQALDTYLTLMGKSFESNKDVFGTDKNGEIDGGSYLNSPKFKQQFRSQENRTNMQAEYFIDALRSMKGVASRLNISGVDIEAFTSDPTNLSKAINLTKEIFEDAVAHAMEQDNEEYATFLRDSQESIDVDLISEQGFLGPLGLRLTGMGITLQPKSTDSIVTSAVDEEMADNVEDIDEDQIETIHNRVYDLDMMEKSLSVLADVKLYLSTIPQVGKGYIWGPETGAPNEWDYELNQDTLLDNKIDSAKVISKLFGVLKGSENINDMMYKLEKALVASPELAPIYYDLKEESPRKTRVFDRKLNGELVGSVEEVNVKKNIMFSTFAKQSYDMFSMLDYGKGDVQFRQSNQNSGTNRIISNWEGSAVKPENQANKAQREQLKAELVKIAGDSVYTRDKNNKMVKATFAEAMNMTSNGIPTPDVTLLRRIASIYNKAGFTGLVEADFLAIAHTFAHNPDMYNSKKDTETIGTFAELINKINDRVLMKTLDGENIFGFKSKGDQMGEMRALRILATPVLERQPDLVAGSFINTSGKIKHQINLSSFAQDVLTKAMNSSGKEIHPSLVNNTVLMAAASDPNFRFQTFDEFADKTAGKKSTAWNDMPTMEVLQTKFNAFFSGADNSDYFKAMGITQANRGKTLGIVLPKMKTKDQLRAWTKSKLSVELNRIRKDYSEAVENDPNRKVFKDYSTTIKGGEIKLGRASHFNIFTSLENVPDLLDRVRKGTDTIENLVAEYTDQAMASIGESVNEDLQFMEEQGFLVRRDGLYEISEIAKTHLSNKSLEASNADIRNFLINNFISTIDQTQLFMGDLAFYKSDIDVNKRFSLPFTPGVRVSDDVGVDYYRTVLSEPKVKSEIASMLNSLGRTDQYNSIELADGLEFVSMRMALNTTIGRGLQSEGFLAMFNRAIKNGGKNLGTVQNWLRNDRTVESQKPFYFAIQEDENGNRYPVSSKTSFIPANPELFEQLDKNNKPKYPGLYAISKMLNSPEFKAQTLPMVSAAKAGSFNPVSIGQIEDAVATGEDLGDKHYQLMNTENLRFPQKEATKNSVLKKMGSQMRMLIMSNYQFLADNEVAEGDTAETLLSKYNNSIKNIIDKGVRNIYSKLSPSERSMGDIKKDIISEAEKSTYDNSEYTRQALMESKNGESLASLNWPPIRAKLSSVLTKRFRRASVGFKLPGYDAVQISSVGTGEVGIDTDLKFSSIVRRDGKPMSKEETAAALTKTKRGQDLSPEEMEELTRTYKIGPAEIRITPNYFMNNIKKNVLKNFSISDTDRAKLDANLEEYAGGLIEEGYSAEEIQEFSSHYEAQLIEDLKKRKVEKVLMSFTDDQGNFDINKINNDKSGVADVILYRTPTQGKNSMLKAVIKDFLPPTMGSSIMVPAEIVTQSGSDFDIDKIAIIFREFSMGRDERGQSVLSRKEGTDLANIFEMHDTVLSAISSSYELFSPNSTSLLEDPLYSDPKGELMSIKDTYGKNEPINNFSTVKAQEVFRINNASGDMMIGRSSLASVFKSNAKLVGLKFTSKLLGEEFDISRTYNDQGTLISKDIEAIQNAALDNASNPLLGNLNINDETSDVFLAMVLGGKGLPFATAVLNSPMVRAYTRSKLLYADKGPQRAHELALNDALGQFNTDVFALYRSKPGEYNYTSAHIAATTMSSDTTAQLESLNTYIELNKGAGASLSGAIQDFSFTSKGPGGTLSAVLKKAMSLANIKGTNTNDNKSRSSDYVPVVDSVPSSELVSKIREDNSKIELKKGGWIVKATGKRLKGVNRFLFGESTIDPKYQVNVDAGIEIDAFARGVLNPNVVQEYYTASLLRSNPDKIYVFGDNNMGRGLGGQATIRNEENAFGIPTKKEPSNRADAFYSDAEYEQNVAQIDAAIKKIKDDGRQVMFPKDGIGTGLAQLKTKAPKTYEYLNNALRTEFNFNNGGESVSSSMLSETAQKKLTAYFNKIKRELEKQNITNIVTDEDSLRVFDEKKGVMGVLDILASNASNRYIVLDIKSRSKLNPEDWNTKAQGEKWLAQRQAKEGKQLNAYREILRNKYNLDVASMGIIELKPIIEDGVVIDVEFPKQAFRLSPKEDVLGDTRATEVTESDVLKFRDADTSTKKYSVDKDLYNENHISSIEKAAFSDLLKLSHELVPTLSYGYQRVLQAFEKSVGYIAPNQEERILSALDTYLLQNGTIGKELNSSYAAMNTPQNRLAQFNSATGVGAQVQEYIDRKEAEGDELNPFIEALNVVHLDNDLSKKYVTINSAYNRGLTKDKQVDLMNAFEALLNSESDFERRLAKRIASYGLLNYGFNTSPHSFMNFIPPIAFTTGIQGKSSPLDFFKQAQSTDLYGNTNEFTAANINSFLTMYVQNNAKSLGLPTYSPADVLALMEGDNNLPKFIFISKKVGTSNGKNVYESELHQFSSTDYVPLQQKGVQGYSVEYGDYAGSIYNDNPDNLSIQTSMSAPASEVIPENIESIAEVKRLSDQTQAVSEEAAVGSITDINTLEDFIKYKERNSNLSKKLAEDFIRSNPEILNFKGDSAVLEQKLYDIGVNLGSEELGSFFKLMAKDYIMLHKSTDDAGLSALIVQGIVDVSKDFMDMRLKEEYFKCKN